MDISAANWLSANWLLAVGYRLSVKGQLCSPDISLPTAERFFRRKNRPDCRLPLPSLLIASLLIASLSLAGCGTSDVLLPDSSAPIYYGTIESIDNVYDGDTIRDVAILIYPFHSPIPGMSEAQLTLWPGIERRADGIYSITDIRIAGIDTPEKHPIRGDRTEASIQREKERAEAATDFLKQLLLDNSKDDGTLGFVIQNPEPDLYGGRIVADVICFKDGISTDVAEALLEAGHAVIYDGGTKTHDWGAE